MAITVINKASLFSGTNAASYATGSWTPTTGRLAICCVQSEISGTTNVPTVSGNGLTWSAVTNYQDDTSGTTSRITVFVAKTAGGSAGAVTADFGGQTQVGCNIIVDEADGVDVSGTALQAIVQSVTGTVGGSGTSETITLSALGSANNASYGVFHHQAAETTSNGSGYTTLGVGSHAGPNSAMQTEYKAAGSTTVDASWTTSSGKGGIALEIKVASSGQTITVNQNTETDTSQATGKVKQKAITQNTEIDLSQAITRVKQLAIGQNLEADSVQAIARVKIRTVGQVIEIDLAQTVTKVKQRAIGQNTETDSAQVVTFVSAQTVTQVVETDSVQLITVRKIKAIGQASETDLAQSITKAGAGQIIVPVEQVQETNTAQTITRVKIHVVVQISETDLAQSLFKEKRVAVVQTIEIDLSQSTTTRKIKAVAQITETDLAQIISRLKSKSVLQVTEIDFAQIIAWSPKHRSVALATEIDSAQVITNLIVIIEAHYIYFVPFENRVYVIPVKMVEERIALIPVESRIYVVPFEAVETLADRTTLIPAENRLVEVTHD